MPRKDIVSSLARHVGSILINLETLGFHITGLILILSVECHDYVFHDMYRLAKSWSQCLLVSIIEVPRFLNLLQSYQFCLVAWSTCPTSNRIWEKSNK